ncbi:heme biosynthesis protein HemY [Aestuariivirga litoralis]|uniref:heme biosynthesis protein HemY n=1 Tax=Aestuariivirga litoralis TaxID=2650924 RepID=UPI0018C617FF|nr:heme biosynthesis HemY N-terminal domain-containing protein [Aestuariivirga litoralis]MBG1232501.1 heme biosynthesis protein HemY [Aestuariivirga litoralis]
MLTLLWRLALLVAAGLGIMWLADRPGTVNILWLGKEIHLSVLMGLIIIVVSFAAIYVVLRIINRIWRVPSDVRGSLRERKTRKAYESLSRGIIAAGAGDAQAAQRHAALAGDTLHGNPLVKLLGAQAAQLRGDRDEVRRVFETMTGHSDTELLGLRGLFAHARDNGDWHAARLHAEAAHAKNNRLPWASAAVLQSLLAHKDFEAAARNVAQQGKSGLMTKAEAARKQAALLTAAALAVEDSNKPHALELAASAHGLDMSLVPAAALLARLQSAGGHPRKAWKVLRSTYALSPHRELAAVVAHLHDDEPEKQYERVRDLTSAEPSSLEGRYALAQAAVAADRHQAAREILAPLLDNQPPAGICALMAEVEDAAGEAVKSHSWLTRALAAPRDPVWVSDGVASARWVAVSPVTGEIVPAEWKAPFEQPVQAKLGFHPRVDSAAKSPAGAPTPTAALPRPPDDPGVEQSS